MTTKIPLQLTNIGVYSAEQASIAALTEYTFTHGLGGLPDIVQAHLECTSTDAGYAVGDYILLQEMHTGVDSLENSRGATTMFNATDVLVSFANGVGIFHKTTGAYTNLTLSNWDLHVKAIKFA